MRHTRIELIDWDDKAAMAVLRDLDVNDAVEAVLFSSHLSDPLARFAWCRAGAGATAIALSAARPFALVALAPSGAEGVFNASFLARDHGRWRGDLGRLAVMLRARMPQEARPRAITRIECRSCSGHPTAGRLLAAIGFRREAEMAGFAGGAVFHQWAWAPDEREET